MFVDKPFIFSQFYAILQDFLCEKRIFCILSTKKFLFFIVYLLIIYASYPQKNAHFNTLYTEKPLFWILLCGVGG